MSSHTPSDETETETETTAERVGRETLGELARMRLREHRVEYLHAVERIEAGEEPTPDELAQLRAANRALQQLTEDRIARLVDGAEPWEGTAEHIPYGELADTLDVSLSRLRELDPAEE